MQLFLLRHGPAEAPIGYPSDSERPLSKEGRELMLRAALGIARLVPKISAMHTSPLLRARETGALVGEAIAKKGGYDLHAVTSELLQPETPLEDALALLDGLDHTRAYLMVSHEPLLSTLASALIGATSPVVEFKTGTLVHLGLMGAGVPAILHASYPAHALAIIGHG